MGGELDRHYQRIIGGLGTMRKLARITGSLGFIFFMAGMATMDNPTFIGCVLIFGGLSIMWGGLSIEERL